MKYPALKVDITKLKFNTKLVVKSFKDVGIEISGNTKVFCANPYIAQTLVDGGIRSLADSRIDNLRKLSYIPVSKMYLRAPMLSEVDNVVEYADISLNSELKTIEALAKAARSKGKKHDIMMMVDLGERREGVLKEDAMDFAGKVLKIQGVSLKGIGVNLNYNSSILSKEKQLCDLVSIANNIENAFHFKFDLISGGNSGSFCLLKNKKIPSGINHLRIGETILRGYETASEEKFEGLNTDVFTFVAEIIELKDKPSHTSKESQSFDDKGITKRAVLACGFQDVLCEHLIPKDSTIQFIDSSSDHMIVDITNSPKQYKLGSKIEFSLSYNALLTASSSQYVAKVVN